MTSYSSFLINHRESIMRYVGCKRRLLPFIYNKLQQNDVKGNTFCDLFAGTATVGTYFKRQGYRIISNDLLYSSYVQQQVKIKINAMPNFRKLASHLGLNKKCTATHFAQAVIDYLNQLNGNEGFIYQHYSPGGTALESITRMYFTDENAKKIDVIREQIESWKTLRLINNDEFYVLLYALLVGVSQRANTTATQSSFLKKIYPKALKPLLLKLPHITPGNKNHEVYCENSLHLMDRLPEVDILYVDPPYTVAQYAAAYHLLETIARWDNPILHGVSGKRETAQLYSTFSSKRHALNSLKQIITRGRYRYLLMSYSSDGLISHEQIMSLLQQQGDVVVSQQLLKRYNSMSPHDPRTNPRLHVEERLYCLKRYPNQLADTHPIITASEPIIANAFQSFN
jgi:adenine-specific DNA-methyltransferase